MLQFLGPEIAVMLERSLMKMSYIMRTLSYKLQVITITHLPQVAAKGNHHFKVQKSMSNGKTVTSLKKLSNDERIEEIAMMLSGNEITPTAIAHAKQLMN